MYEWLDHWEAGLEDGSYGVGMSIDAIVVGTAEVSCDAQNVLEVSRYRSVPAICIVRGLKVRELVSPKDLDSLPRGSAAEHSENHTSQTYLQYEFV